MRISSLLLLVCSLLSTPDARAQRALGSNVRVYRSLDSKAKITVKVQSLPSANNRGLVQFFAPGHLRHQMVFLAKRIHSRRGSSYSSLGGGGRIFESRGGRMRVKGTIREYSELYLGSKKHRVIFDEALSRKEPVGSLVRKYRAAQGLDATSRGDAKRRLDAARDEARKACASPRLELKVRWRSFRRMPQLAAMGVSYARAMARLCRVGAAKRRILRKNVRRLYIYHRARGKAHLLDLSDGAWSIGANQAQFNSSLLAQQWLEKQL